MNTSKWTKTALLAVTLAGITLGISGCTKQEPAQSQNQGGTKPVRYICPMDHDVVSDKPGKCPKCGMDLVEEK